ncbi:MAG TPA: DDE-type integrase/transposase/recombinase, partial [Ktedonobacteraceae bacterium]
SVTTDGHRSSPRAIPETMKKKVAHRTNVYLNTCIEQDHRGIKQRSSPIRRLGNVATAARLYCAFDEVRQFFKVAS